MECHGLKMYFEEGLREFDSTDVMQIEGQLVLSNSSWITNTVCIENESNIFIFITDRVL